jgi:hypothetical protein
VKAAKAQQIVPNDRKHPNPVGIRVIKMEASQLFSQPLQRLAEGTLRRFTRDRRLAARPRTVAKIRMMSSQAA